MIDLGREQLIPISHAAKAVPGRGVHRSTVYRWVMKGVNGIKLESVKRGGGRFTSREAIDRFIVAATEGPVAISVEPDSAALEEEAEQLGI